ncbi:hypothetical protein 2050HW_00311 [Serratia phage vB_SmaM_ 2050HW]|uniref:Uncharacterized protein n=1 Tax=Serratia phage vB_SmaM_ 2050HW TaxID=2024252 RepID=A0A289YN15_9CAUD|nr:hypothetical protein HWB23_gp311 [Serratia phage vB_SmaM_ 2050HW]ATA65646.1 hypothetical protein 2050HW_00311 [Serratia phage vB_SmaM_ 2050HW]
MPDVLDDAEWADLTDVVIQPDQNFVTVLIDETGITTQQQKLLLQATDRMNPNRDLFADMLVQAADNLTKGAFMESLGAARINPLDIGERQDPYRPAGRMD